MQPLPAPVGRREERRLDLLPQRRACLVVVVVERVREDVIAELAAVLLQVVVGERLVAAHRRAADAAARPALAEPVLHRLHLHVVPVRPEGREDAAVVRHVAVPVRRAFPDAHRGKVRRPERGHVPLVDAVVGNAVQDAVVEVAGLARREMVDEARRAPRAARIDAHAGVALGDPFLRVDHFPVLVLVARTAGDVGMLRHHALPGARIAVLEREPFRVGAVAQNNRIAARSVGKKDVGAQHQSIVHADGNVPVDPQFPRFLLGRQFEPAPSRVSTRVQRPNSSHIRRWVEVCGLRAQQFLRRAGPEPLASSFAPARARCSTTAS